MAFVIQTIILLTANESIDFYGLVFFIQNFDSYIHPVYMCKIRVEGETMLHIADLCKLDSFFVKSQHS